jgi:hypothetical protein
MIFIALLSIFSPSSGGLTDDNPPFFMMHGRFYVILAYNAHIATSFHNKMEKVYSMPDGLSSKE